MKKDVKKLEDFSTTVYESGEALMEHNLEIIEQCETEQEIADMLNTVEKIMIATIGYHYVEEGYRFDLGAISKAELIRLVVNAIMKRRNQFHTEFTPEQINKCINIWQMSHKYTIPDIARHLYKDYKVSELKELAAEIGFVLEGKALKRDIASALAKYIRAITDKYYTIWEPEKQPKSANELHVEAFENNQEIYAPVLEAYEESKASGNERINFFIGDTNIWDADVELIVKTLSSVDVKEFTVYGRAWNLIDELECFKEFGYEICNVVKVKNRYGGTSPAILLKSSSTPRPQLVEQCRTTAKYWHNNNARS